MSQQDTSKRGPGRPRSAAAKQKALQAAQDILMKQGFGRLTIEAVASASGVGKPTIYRNWANAQELAMEALILQSPDTAPSNGSAPPRAALTAQLRRLITAFATTRGRQITQALASADPDSEFTRAFRNRVILTSREAGRTLIERAVADGHLNQPPDIEALLDMIYGPLFFRLLAGHHPLEPALANAIADTVFAALAPSHS